MRLQDRHLTMMLRLRSLVHWSSKLSIRDMSWSTEAVYVYVVTASLSSSKIKDIPTLSSSKNQAQFQPVWIMSPHVSVEFTLKVQYINIQQSVQSFTNPTVYGTVRNEFPVGFLVMIETLQ